MKKLLFSLSKADFKIDTFRSGGKGGQHQNTTNSGVRITHIESGGVGESREQRKQGQNMKIAFTRMYQSKKFQTWFRIKCAEMLSGETVEEKVEKSLVPANLKVEYRDVNGHWKTIKD